jgi:pimeloyl-ACP methyl ester carboxylesterase
MLFPCPLVCRPGRLLRLAAVAFAVSLCSAGPAAAQSVSSCGADGLQDSGSIYRICMPTGPYNGMLVVWAHGYQDADLPVSIPENQLCFSDFCLPDLINGLGFAFATNSYSKTGLAVRQGQADILDLVNIFSAQQGQPSKVYLLGASEGGLITTLSIEQRPDVFAGGVAACGPIGDFPFSVAYFGHARATFNVFFPGVIPGDPFHPSAAFAAQWRDYYANVVRPAVFAPANRSKLDQWVAVANLPYDANNYLATVEQSVSDALRYSVLNINDFAATLGGFPFDNRRTWYHGSKNDFLLNLFVPRVSADAAALAEMQAHYTTTGILVVPLMTLHTTLDQQVPYVNETFYNAKTLLSGALFTRHVNIPVSRYGHCNFTQEEALFAFALMLAYDGQLVSVSGTASALSEPALAEFERNADAVGLRHDRAGSTLKLNLKQR